ncbi:LmbE family protein [Chthoniobacter flavus Ellin428]|uniref:LmbE family protein n=1 Tax=Chthoniobacter flavus Ellin428 TaxID=497964 RepID=B4D7C1_9BACT|nr:PIG-L deacetylase family protein [Chthoniobacter flavus]EDY17772.1 LmbE family protein [Chthoniobacter flavus Ellin428]TCO87096.1 LmbE family N-acetylglucosaminyl deacetylase [Chthoniobacter flavus]
MNPPSRRTFVKASVLATPLLLAQSPTLIAAAETAKLPLRVVCVGAHPDDPESSCAGTLALYAQAGHKVSIIYLTKGERGIPGKSEDEAAAIRSAEAEAACQIIGAEALFAGQIDGATTIDSARTDEMGKLLSSCRPDIVFTHWPIDAHRDHQAASVLTFRAVQAIKPHPHLYYFEVDTGSESQGFPPNTYVDVSSVLDAKKAALFAHHSQHGEVIWSKHHEPIATWRGREAGVPMAEAFFRLNRGPLAKTLPGT